MSKKVIFLNVDRVLRMDRQNVTRCSLYALEYLTKVRGYSIVVTCPCESIMPISDFFRALGSEGVDFYDFLPPTDVSVWNTTDFADTVVLEDFSRGWAIHNWLTEWGVDDYVVVDSCVNLGSTSLNEHLLTTQMLDADCAFQIVGRLG